MWYMVGSVILQCMTLTSRSSSIGVRSSQLAVLLVLTTFHDYSIASSRLQKSGSTGPSSKLEALQQCC